MKNKVCLITGSTSGIGQATALGLAQLGATVVVLARDETRGQKTLEYIREKSSDAHVKLFKGDLSKQDSIRGFAEEFIEQFERLDVLINNAGVATQHGKNTVDGIDTLFAVNYLAPFLL
ncbi:MAG: SDR family NAD(P)-dependent oxidoreductase, partial [Nitrososphaerales archaeon]